MKFIIVQLTLLLVISNSIGQSLPPKCELRIANENWLQQYNQTNLVDKQLNLIVQKVLADTIFAANEDPDLNCNYKIHFQINDHSRKNLRVVLNKEVIEKLLPKLIKANIKSISKAVLPYWKRGFYCSSPEPLPRIISIEITSKGSEVRKILKELVAQNKIATMANSG